MYKAKSRIKEGKKIFNAGDTYDGPNGDKLFQQGVVSKADEAPKQKKPAKKKQTKKKSKE